MAEQVFNSGDESCEAALKGTVRALHRAIRDGAEFTSPSNGHGEASKPAPTRGGSAAPRRKGRPPWLNPIEALRELHSITIESKALGTALVQDGRYRSRRMGRARRLFSVEILKAACQIDDVVRRVGEALAAEDRGQAS